jgi:hypothetical protein
MWLLLPYVTAVTLGDYWYLIWLLLAYVAADTSSICNKEFRDFTLIKTMVARFAGTGYLIIRYCDGRTK